jgi:hypothetical protein
MAIRGIAIRAPSGARTAAADTTSPAASFATEADHAFARSPPGANEAPRHHPAGSLARAIERGSGARIVQAVRARGASTRHLHEPRRLRGATPRATQGFDLRQACRRHGSLSRWRLELQPAPPGDMLAPSRGRVLGLYQPRLLLNGIADRSTTKPAQQPERSPRWLIKLQRGNGSRAPEFSASTQFRA